MTANRPKIKLKLTKTDKIIEGISTLGIITLLILPCYYYDQLPESIPTHFNGSGQADAFGDRSTVFLIPVFALISYISLTALSRFPHIFNYPTEITEENAAEQYAKATSLVRILNLIVIFVMGYITLQTIQTALGNSEGLGSMFLICFIIIMQIPVFYFVFSRKKNKTKQTTN